jgi:hypothetical protein
MNRVYVVQRPAYFCRIKKGWVNKYDLTEAKKFGELVYLLRPGNIYADKLEGAIAALKIGLADYTSDDSILAIGDPVAIGATVLVAGRKTGGRVAILKYDRISENYDRYIVEI